MSYAKRLRGLAKKVIPILQASKVEDRYLELGGALDPPKTIRAPTQSDSKFQAEQALGDWAEDTLCEAINRLNGPAAAAHYGDNSKILAEDEAFRDAYKQGIIDTLKFGKKADLLLLPRVANVPTDLTTLGDNELKSHVASSIGALEVRSSRTSAAVYRDYQAARLKAKKKPAYMEPNFTLKVEDLAKVFRWIHLNDKPQAYVQVFFDEIHAIGFAEMLDYIGSAKKLKIETHDRSAKTTIMIPISNGLKIGEVTKEPDFVVEHNRLQSGRHDIFARPKGGQIDVDLDALLKSLE